MTVRILRRLKALEDLEEIADFIAKDSLESALRFLENTESSLQRLAESPGCGSPFLSELPELENQRIIRVAGFPNHLIFYVEHADAVEVVRILHGARDLDSELRVN